MPTINKNNGIEMADIAKINEQDVPSGGGGTATTSPTLSTMSSVISSSKTVTITNYTSYTQPFVSASVFIGSTEIVGHANVTDTNGVLSWQDTNTSTSTRTVKVRVQEFGNFVQSAEVTGTYDIQLATFRYFRCQVVNSSGNADANRIAVSDWRYKSSGTDYPSNMTSDTAPTPFVASAGHSFNSNYLPYKAFDASIYTFWYSHQASAANNYIDIDMGASYTFQSGHIRFRSFSAATHVTISGSTDGTNYTVINDTMPLSFDTNISLL